MGDKTTKEQYKPAEHLKKYQWVKGKSGNPKGRPKGKLSPIDNIRQMFQDNPDDFDEFLSGYLNDTANRKHIIEMLDGRPMQRIDHSSMGKELPTPILNVFTNDSNKEGDGNDEENSSNSRRNVSE